ncbi:MAG: hypothetical protein V1780_06705 [Chloroflexota bacterium]
MPNDWAIKQCLSWCLALLLALVGLVGLVGLAGLGYDVPVLRPAVGLAFLTLVPGTLILRILKIHHRGVTERGAKINRDKTRPPLSQG